MKLPLFNKRALLTGAGWSRNWGGLTADEVWNNLMSHPNIQANAAMRALLREEPSFENALGKARNTPYASSDAADLERAIVDVFRKMDREIGRVDRKPWVNIYEVKDLLFRFSGPQQTSRGAGFLFTLNQDLFFERHLYDGPSGTPPPALPGMVMPRSDCLLRIAVLIRTNS